MLKRAPQSFPFYLNVNFCLTPLHIYNEAVKHNSSTIHYEDEVEIVRYSCEEKRGISLIINFLIYCKTLDLFATCHSVSRLDHVEVMSRYQPWEPRRRRGGHQGGCRVGAGWARTRACLLCLPSLSALAHPSRPRYL